MWMPFLLMLVIISETKADNPFDEDDDELGFALNRLYRDSDRSMDPHNMLPTPGEKTYPLSASIGAKGMDGPSTGGGDDGQDQDRGKESEAEERCSRELSGCLDRLDSLQNSLEKEQIASLQLQKMLAKEGILDLQVFYRRAVQHIWNTLRLEDGEEILRDGNTALMRRVTVRVTLEDLESLHSYLKTEKEPHRVDEFFERGFTLEDLPSDPPHSLLHALHMLVASTLQAGKSLELWLTVMSIGFLALGLWAVVLFVRDIQKELRWGRVLTMMATLVFFICCLWHWRHMYKMAESRRHAQLAKRGYAGIPEECQPGSPSSTTGNVYGWIKVNIFGSPDVCERYFEELMIDSIEEITPGMVIAETLSRFILQPLQHLGTESGKLTTNFYKNVPVAYHLHATVLFLGLLIVALFFGCAYGIDFPLGLGGFRPMTRPESNPSAGTDAAGLGREAVEQLKRDREKFLEESRRMLSDISQAAVGWQGQHQPLLVASSGILEAQLEQLISRHLTRAMEQGHPSVRTITSTPLRSEGPPPLLESQAQEEQQSQGMLVDLSSSSEGSADPSGLLVSTDAVHRRMNNKPPVKVLPPRSSQSSSRSSSAASTPTQSTVSSPASTRQKLGKFLRKVRSEEEPASPAPSPSVSTQSLGQAGLDEPDLGIPPDSDSFLAEVRSILDLSGNSDPGSPRNSTRGNCSAQVRPPAPPTPCQEVQVSREGVRYTKPVQDAAAAAGREGC